MFGIGTTEILVILVVALIVLGPKSLPKVARTLGKGLAEFRRVSTDFQRTINTEIALDEHEKEKKAAEKKIFGDDSKAEATPTPEPTTESSAQDSTGNLAVAPDNADVPPVAEAASKKTEKEQA
ncbi:Sec-independent protein translocase protein TatB [Halodesulfovibrio sp.]|jgi:sec-independent protein translocase protein TatB|uniref:Sec-independent protein translocase protein TatB n=1 Tax=Halodesulfovibrio sp. TaxID=1912772 RepID=UPI0025FA88B8|nr:Sec-independent protein translocase protein TatB [Halodesulfovibrio sp.]MCT4534161.1 Sec-independent protein translocase protein TatB [Halodesulfovibrio sp.]MCT4625925.1 Sec-independent protein translocase protein TatB [Halodesulfovibrio sp.]